MNVLVVIISINNWERYTLPLIQSTLKHEPTTHIVVIDNDSDTPYPQTEGVTILRTRRLCYSAALNHGVKNCGVDWDYLISVSDDVLVTGPFFDHLRALPPGCMGGPAVSKIVHYYYVGGWCMVIPRHVWETVGEFDGNFLVSAWEDADYSWRVMEAGGRLILMEGFPFYHLDQRQRQKTTFDIGKVHIWNGAYFERKHHIPAPLCRYSPAGFIDSRWL
jgi:hypothetical protein